MCASSCVLIDAAALVASGLLRRSLDGVRLLGNGAVYPPLLVYVTRWFDKRRGSAVAFISSGQYVAGVRYRAWQPASALHPTIGVHTPLVFDGRNHLDPVTMKDLGFHYCGIGRAAAR